MPHQPTDKQQEVSRLVVRSYRRSKRDLPWRNTKDAYAIWISEIMLQQTRVAAVIPYFERWLRSFPSLQSLATADLDDVLAQWSGLGYYSRARNIHSCAKEVVQSYQGRLPQTATELRGLPGIGPYTAGAISSIAYGAQEPLVDGNVARLLSRVFAVEANIKSTVAIKEFWRLCTAMVPKKTPGDFNQGLMELGALTCLPKNPKCQTCPLRDCCVAFKDERTSELPVVSKRKAAADKELLESDAVFLLRKGKVLLAQRKAEGLYGGLWELPQAKSRTLLEPLTGLRLVFSKAKPSMVHNQVLSHRRLQIRVWPASATGRRKLAAASSYQQLSWQPLTALTRLGISSATKTILEQKPLFKSTAE